MKILHLLEEAGERRDRREKREWAKEEKSLCELRRREERFQDGGLGNNERRRGGMEEGREFIQDYLKPVMNMNNVWSVL